MAESNLPGSGEWLLTCPGNYPFGILKVDFVTMTGWVEKKRQKADLQKVTIIAPNKFGARYSIGGSNGLFEAVYNGDDRTLAIKFMGTVSTQCSAQAISLLTRQSALREFMAENRFERKLDAFMGVTGARPGIRNWINSTLRTRGFAPAGRHSIGIVAYPRTTLGNIMKGRVPVLPETIQTLGHTAEILRIDGRIAAVRGFEPNLSELLLNYGNTVSGRSSVGGYYSKVDDALLTKRYAMTAEYPISEQAARTHLRHMNTLSETELRWTGVSELANAGETNCLRWAIEDASRVSPEFAMELGVGSNSSQGNLMARLKELRDLQRAGEYNGRIVVGEMPPNTALRAVGTGLFVLGAGMTIVELQCAKGDPRQGELTGRAVGSFASSIVVPEAGIALCAILGVATGGLALIPIAICLGIGAATIGGDIGAEMGSSLDYHPEGEKPLPQYWTTGGAGSGVHSRDDIARVR